MKKISEILLVLLKDEALYNYRGWRNIPEYKDATQSQQKAISALYGYFSKGGSAPRLERYAAAIEYARSTGN